MAEKTFTISGHTGSNWDTITFTITSGSESVSNAGNITNIAIGSVSFTPSRVLSFGAGTEGSKYVTFRENDTITQFPKNTDGVSTQTGYSLDVWSDAFYTAVNGGTSWDSLSNTYTLSSDKHTLVYNYSAPYAPYFSKGGTVTVA